MAYTAWSVVAFEQPTAAKWNQLGDNDAYLKDVVSPMDTPSAFRAYLSANQDVPTATNTPVELDTTMYNYGSDFDTAQNIYIAPEDGVYIFVGKVGYVGLADGVRALLTLKINEGGGITGNDFKIGGSSRWEGVAPGIIKLNADDEIRMDTYHDAGITEALDSSDTLT